MEDVEVLQKELVQVQTLMDSMTREREAESERLQSRYEQLQADYTTSEVGEPNRLVYLQYGSAESLFAVALPPLNCTHHKCINVHTGSPLFARSSTQLWCPLYTLTNSCCKIDIHNG